MNKITTLLFVVFCHLSLSAQINTDDFFKKTSKLAPEKALLVYEGAASKFKAAGQLNEYSRCHSNIGSIYLDMSDLANASTNSQLALDIANSIKDGSGTRALLDALELNGAVAYYQKNYEKAVDLFEHELALVKPLNDYEKLAKVYNDLGSSYGDVGRLDKQLEMLHEGLRIRKSLPDTTNGALADTYYNLSMAYGQVEDFQSQETYARKALYRFERDYDKTSSNPALAYSSLASAARGSKNYTLSLFYYQKVLQDRIRKLGEKNPRVAQTYANIGIVYRLLKDYAVAESYLLKSVDINLEIGGEKNPILSTDYVNLANLYLEINRPNDALAYLQKALKLIAPGFTSDQYEDCPKSDECNSKTTLLQILRSKGTAFLLRYNAEKKAGYLNTALGFYTQALEILTAQQSSYAAEKERDRSKRILPIYEGMISVYQALFEESKDKSNLRKAFEIAEKSRAFVLLQQMRDVEAKNLGGVPDSLLVKEVVLKKELDALEKTLFTAKLAKNDSLATATNQNIAEKRKTYNDLIAVFERDYKRYYLLKYSLSQTTTADVQRHLLRSNDMMIEYYYGNQSLYIFAISTNDIQLFTLKLDEQFAKNIKTLRVNLSDNDYVAKSSPDEVYGDFVRTARLLYQQLLGNVLEHKSHIKRLFIIPDGALAFIPFEVLLSKDIAQGTPYHDLPYLINNYRVIYNYSATVMLQNKNKHPNNNGQCLALAPVFEAQANGETRSDNTADSRLPATRRELGSIEEHFKGMYLLDEAATETVFKEKAGEYGILHLATHGHINTNNPLYSKLAFSPNPSDTLNDGYLEAYELNTMTLNAGLVVLSSCETGAGRYERGEGILSLARNFMIAGSPNLVMTLWSVNDAASADLMERFYTQLALNKDIDEALRQAKLQYIASKNNALGHPSFWAGFVTIGNGGNLTGGVTAWWRWLMTAIVGLLALWLVKKA